MDYKAAYLMLFNAITRAIDELQASQIINSNITSSLNILQEVQLAAEAMYMMDKLKPYPSDLKHRMKE